MSVLFPIALLLALAGAVVFAVISAISSNHTEDEAKDKRAELADGIAQCRSKLPDSEVQPTPCSTMSREYFKRALDRYDEVVEAIAMEQWDIAYALAERGLSQIELTRALQLRQESAPLPQEPR